MKKGHSIKFAFSLLFFSHFLFSQAPNVQIFPVPQDALPAVDYKLKVNGQEVFVYNSDYNPFAILNFIDSIDIEVITQSDLKWVTIRPLNDSIKWKINGNSLFFKLIHPVKLSIEINGETTRALFLFAGSIVKPDANQYPGNIIRYEGGKIYNTGVIKLKSNDVLIIEGGAIVKGSIEAENAENIKIVGYGILDGTISGSSQPKRMIDLLECRNVLIEDILIHNSPGWTIVPSNCNGVQIRNIKQVNWKFGSDGIDLVGSSGIRIEKCFMKNNDDCIAIKSFDPINKYPDRKLNIGRNVHDIIVDRCTFWNMPWGNALEIGFELRCDSINNISFTNIDIIHVERGAALSIHNGDYAMVSDINYENITIEDDHHKLIDLAIFLSQYSIDRPESIEERKARYMNGAWDGVLRIYPGEEKKYETNRGSIKNINFKNIKVIDGPFPFSIISGYNTSHSITDVHIKDLKILSEKIHSPSEAHLFMNDANNVDFK
jgi:hypothetical protein